MWLSFLGMLVVFFVVWVGWIFFSRAYSWSIEAYEKIAPSSRFYIYESVTPINSWFKVGQLIEFESTAIKKNNIEMRWEDTLYCDRGDFTRKLGTQYRPEVGTDISYRWVTKITRWYYLPVDISEQRCKMCWLIVGYTPLGYPKESNYCTEYFAVNI